MFEEAPKSKWKTGIELEGGRGYALPKYLEKYSSQGGDKMIETAAAEGKYGEILDELERAMKTGEGLVDGADKEELRRELDSLRQ